jgi:predicted nucleotidyltransferase
MEGIDRLTLLAGRRYRKIPPAGLYSSRQWITDRRWHMTREEIIGKLKAMEPELRARGITRMQMFGSRARGDERPDSDLDLLIEYERPATATGFDFFGIGPDLTEALGVDTNVVEDHNGMKPRFRREIAPDLVTVFG